eukprot:6913559-Pyramimonas_sp.AAC.1
MGGLDWPHLQGHLEGVYRGSTGGLDWPHLQGHHAVDAGVDNIDPSVLRQELQSASQPVSQSVSQSVS